MERAAFMSSAAEATTISILPVIVAAAIPAIAAIVAAIIATRSAGAARRSESSAQFVRDLEARIAERKFTVYEPMIELLRRVLDPKDAPAILADEDAYRASISKFAAWIAIYGSDEAITYFQRFMQCTYRSATPAIMVRMYAEFVLAARRDMGYPDTKITGEQILGIRLTDVYEPKWLEVFTMPLTALYAREGWEAPWERAAATGGHGVD